jgi:hypothetical protein
MAEPGGVHERAFTGEYLPDSKRARSAIASILAQIAEAEAAQRAHQRSNPVALKPRRRGKEAQEKFDLAATAVLAELLATLARAEGCIFVPRRKDFLERADRYRSKAINTLLPTALDQLEALGFIRQELGHIGDGGERRRTVVTPGPALRARMEEHGFGSHEFRRERAGDEIVLRAPGADDRATPIEYADDGDTRRMRAEMQIINARIQAADLDLACGHDDPLCSDIDRTRRKLRRIFSRGNFAEGGRLYGGYWQDMKGERRRDLLLIDGAPVAELDYSAAGLRILYGMAGAEPPDGDLYDLPGAPAAKRDDVKAMISALTFVEGADVAALAPVAKRIRPDLAARAGADSDDFERHMVDALAVEAVLRAIKERHAAVAAFLPSLVGHRVQKIESDAMVRALLALAGKQVAALPVHDSLLVRHDHADLAREILEVSFEAVAGVPALVRVK